MEKIWLKNYPKGVPAEINAEAYQSLVDVLVESCALHSKLPAFYSMGVTLTYEQFDADSRAFAAYLQNVLMLKKGDRIALMLPNILQYPVAMFGALRAGLTVVNVNPLYTPPELIHQLKDSGAEAIIVMASFASTVQKALQDLQLKHVIVTQLGDLFPFPKGLVVDFVLNYIKKKVPAWHIPHAIKFKNALNQGKKLKLNPVSLTPQDIAFLQYTGGTTGVAKGAMLSHRNLLANIFQAEAWFHTLKLGKEIVITALPLYHIFSLTANCLYVSKMGGLNVLIINPRDITALATEMSKFKFSIITGVNTLFNALVKNPIFQKLDFSHLKLTLGGGMSVQHAVAEKWHAITGTPVLEAYGLTEASPCVTMNPACLKEFNGTVGLPVSSTQVCILDEQGNELPIGVPGELAVKGPQVMYGYWHNPSETQKVFTKDGWLLTGDIASINEEGFVHICERKKDMILVSGFNVYPNEVEDVLTRLEGVREAAVVGIPDEISGEVVKAFIVRDNENLTVSDIVQYCHKNLTGYKIPKYIEFRKDLPKSNIGKILRRALKDKNTTSAVDS